MSQDSINVDYGTLADLAQQLKNLKAEFEKGDSAIGPLMGAISHHGLKHNLQNFSNNWSDKRRDLIGRLELSSGYAALAADAYRSLSDELVQEFSPDDK